MFEERSQLYADGQRDFTPMHLVIDEVHEVFDAVPGAREFVLDTLGRRGAKRGIRVTIGTQDQNKDTLGLESAGVLSNFITAELQKDERGRRVATVYRGNAGKRQHARQYAVPPLPGAKSFIQAPVARPVAAEAPRAEVVTMRVPERPDALLSSLMAELPDEVRAAVPDLSPERAARLAALLQNSVPAHQDAEIMLSPVPVSEQNSNRNVTRSEVVLMPGTPELRIVVDVDARAESSTPPPPPQRVTRPRPRPAGRGVHRKRTTSLEATYREAGASGASFRSTYAAHRGDRTKMFAAWQEGKAGRK